MAGRIKLKVPGERSPFGGSSLGVKFTVGAEAANAIIVQCQVTGRGGKNVATRRPLRAWLSDAAGSDPVATAPSGAVAASTNGALLDISSSAKKAFLLFTNTTGRVDVSITEAGVKTCYLNVQLDDGSVATSGAITFA